MAHDTQALPGIGRKHHHSGTTRTPKHISRTRGTNSYKTTHSQTAPDSSTPLNSYSNHAACVDPNPHSATTYSRPTQQIALLREEVYTLPPSLLTIYRCALSFIAISCNYSSSSSEESPLHFVSPLLLAAANRVDALSCPTGFAFTTTSAAAPPFFPASAAVCPAAQ